MGDGITDSTDLVITVAGSQAGGQTGSLVLESVELDINRSNDPKVGLGNSEPTAMGYGPKEFSLSAEGHVNKELGSMVKKLYVNDQQPSTAALRSQDTIEARVGKLDWNNINLSASDGGDVTVSIDANCRNVEWDDAADLSSN